MALVGVGLVESEHSIVRAAARRPDTQQTQKKADSSPSVWDGVYTDEQAKRGAPLYSQYCASCHGPELTGGEMAPALAGGDFSSNWNGLTLGDLFERMRVSMPQNDPGGLSRQQNADILAYMLSSSKFPAGTTELARDTEVLKQIRFLSLKPQ
ncbi:MAG: cytochrome c [Acidobacteria bacterium]|nr:cytochrome c [Acidobacteriota bacterium]